MITAKQVYGTYPHVQMRWYIERTKPEATKAAKAAFLGQLVGKFVANCNAQHDYRDDVPADIDVAFTWDDTQEGHNYWAEVNRHANMPEEFVDQWLRQAKPKVMKVPVAAPAPKLKRVGWWA